MKVVSWDGLNINDGANYTTMIVEGDFGLPGVRPVLVGRSGWWPALVGVERPATTKTLRIFIENEASLAALRAALHAAFDPHDEESKRLVVEDQGGSNDRYVMAICRAFEHDRRGSGRVFVATLDVDGDVRWRKVAATTDTWNITGSTDTETVANGGEDDAYPKLTITPTAAKTGHNIYRHWVAIVWRAGAGVQRYPVDIVDNAFDTEALVNAGEMQADGDDIRVVVDGTHANYWLDDMDTDNTSIWCNLDFEPAPATTALLAAAVGSGDTVTSLDSSTDIAGYPASGILLINNEAFVYTGKNDSLRRFTGVTRAAKDTTAANHAADDAMLWVQHDIYITYGNATAKPISVDQSFKPILSLANSSNTSWDYDEFGTNAGLRTGAWRFSSLQNTEKYTGNRTANANPWVEIGIKNQGTGQYHGRWTVTNPCGITAANFANGEKWSNGSRWGAQIISLQGNDWVTEDTIASPSAVSTWESWSDNQTLAAGARGVGLELVFLNLIGGSQARLEVADVTLTLNSSNTPAITVGAQQGNYPLAATIRNNTTGEEIRITMTMDEDESLEVDTDEKTVTYLVDGSNQFGALQIMGSARRDWLRLAPGNNELYFEDTGTTGLTIGLEWQERSYG